MYLKFGLGCVDKLNQIGHDVDAVFNESFIKNRYFSKVVSY